MYEDWVEKSVYASLQYGRLLAHLNETERKLRILESMASELLDYGLFNFHQQNEFPMGKQHFSQLMRVLAKVAKTKNENNFEIKNEIQSNDRKL